MDFDPNRLKAPPGKFRILGIDKFQPPGEDWVHGDYDSLEEALSLARKLTKDASKYSTSPDIATVFYVYDDKGVYKGGDIYKNE
jgi:hypothetical protein